MMVCNLNLFLEMFESHTIFSFMNAAIAVFFIAKDSHLTRSEQEKNVARKLKSWLLNPFF